MPSASTYLSRVRNLEVASLDVNVAMAVVKIWPSCHDPHVVADILRVVEYHEEGSDIDIKALTPKGVTTVYAAKPLHSNKPS